MIRGAGAVAFASSAAATPPDWSGLYAGVHAGGAWGKSTVTDTNGGVDPGPFSYSVVGPFGGATVGSNFQFGNLLVGVEGDLGFMDLTGHGKIQSAHDSIYHQDLTLDGGAYGDVTGRAGFVFGQTLIYGKAGLAFYTGQATQATTYPGYIPTGTGTFTGWTAGFGAETRLTPTMSLKLEYLHFDFGPQGGY